jgi:hypothetical protein
MPDFNPYGNQNLAARQTTIASFDHRRRFEEIKG